MVIRPTSLLSRQRITTKTMPYQTFQQDHTPPTLNRFSASQPMLTSPSSPRCCSRDKNTSHKMSIPDSPRLTQSPPNSGSYGLLPTPSLAQAPISTLSIRTHAPKVASMHDQMEIKMFRFLSPHHNYETSSGGIAAEMVARGPSGWLTKASGLRGRMRIGCYHTTLGQSSAEHTGRCRNVYSLSSPKYL